MVRSGSRIARTERSRASTRPRTRSPRRSRRGTPRPRSAPARGPYGSRTAATGRLRGSTPRLGRMSETIEVGGSPSALAVAGGSVWTAVLASRETHRGGTLRLIWDPAAGKCRCADPIAYNNGQSWALASLAYDGLVTYRRVDGAAGATLTANLASRGPIAERRWQDVRLQAAPRHPLFERSGASARGLPSLTRTPSAPQREGSILGLLHRDSGRPPVHRTDLRPLAGDRD